MWENRSIWIWICTACMWASLAAFSYETDLVHYIFHCLLYRQACVAHKGKLGDSPRQNEQGGKSRKKRNGKVCRVQEGWPICFLSAKLEGNYFIPKLLQTTAWRLRRSQHTTMLTLRCWSQSIGIAIEWNHFQTLSHSKPDFITFRFTGRVLWTETSCAKPTLTTRGRHWIWWQVSGPDIVKLEESRVNLASKTYCEWELIWCLEVVSTMSIYLVLGRFKISELCSAACILNSFPSFPNLSFSDMNRFSSHWCILHTNHLGTAHHFDSMGGNLNGKQTNLFSIPRPLGLSLNSS